MTRCACTLPAPAVNRRWLFGLGLELVQLLVLVSELQLGQLLVLLSELELELELERELGQLLVLLSELEPELELELELGPRLMSAPQLQLEFRTAPLHPQLPQQLHPFTTRHVDSPSHRSSVVTDT